MTEMNDRAGEKRLELLVEQVELPERAYEIAAKRYNDLGDWFGRPGCSLAAFDPHVFVQGSFALGTAIRPIKEGQEYDLDLSCKLRNGIDRNTHSQRDVKDLVGLELQAYRRFRQIQEPLESKHRCWRLGYRDDLPFHMDVVPGILADSARRTQLAVLLENRNVQRSLAEAIATDALWITDDRSPYFEIVHPSWLSSNPEGYIRWFVSRMQGTQGVLKAEAQVDEVPLYRRKSSLQRAIQILKSHRDVMFEHAVDRKPISIILTTLGAEAYVAGVSLPETMATLLRAFDDFRRSNSDVVLNPVNPEENFADRWKTTEGRQFELKENFHRWIVQVTADFEYLLAQTDPREVVKRAQSGWKIRLDESTVATALGTSVASSEAPRRVTIQSAPKPWSTNF